MMGDQLNLNSANLYGALGNYEKSVRERKFQISEAEDTISNLKAAVKDARTQNEKLRLKCDTLQLQSQMEESRFQSEVQKKSKLELIRAGLQSEYDEILSTVNSKKALLEKIENRKQFKIANLKKVEQQHMEEYRQIPLIGEYMRLSEQQKQLESVLEEKTHEIEEKRKALEIRRIIKAENWKSFVNYCIKIATTRNVLQIKLKEYEDLKKQVERESSSESVLETTEVIPVEEVNVDNRQEIQIQNTRSTNIVPVLKSTIQSVESLSSISLEERLQQIRNKTRRFSFGRTVSIGVKRCHNAIDETSAKSNLGNQNNNLLKSIEEIRQRYSRAPLSSTITCYENSRLGMQLKGLKTSYGSLCGELEEPVVTEENNVKSSENRQSFDNCEYIESTLITNQTKLPTQNYESILTSEKVPNAEESLAVKDVVALDSDMDISSTDENSADVAATNSLSKEIDELVQQIANTQPQEEQVMLATSEQETGIFKVPPPPPRATLNSNNSTKSNINDTDFTTDFFQQITTVSVDQCVVNSKSQNEEEAQNVNKETFDGADTGFSMKNMNSGILNIFGNTSSSINDFSNGNLSNTDTESPTMMFTFENLFGTGQNNPLF